MFTVPVGEWFRGESYAWLAGRCRAKHCCNRLFRPEAMEAMLATPP